MTTDAIPPIGTACCTARWSGANTCHCTECHHTFTGITAFDAHRTGSHAKGTRTCLHPTDVGLVDSNRSYACWGFPGADNDWWRASA